MYSLETVLILSGYLQMRSSTAVRQLAENPVSTHALIEVSATFNLTAFRVGNIRPNWW